MSYNRVRDIELGRRAPVKLSEFLLICDVCDADPVQTLRDIIAEAQRIEEKERLKQAIPPTASAASSIQSAVDASVSIRASDYTDVNGESLEETAAREETAKERAMRKYRSGKGYAAYRDSHKYDPDPDIA